MESLQILAEILHPHDFEPMLARLGVARTPPDCWIISKSFSEKSCSKPGKAVHD